MNQIIEENIKLAYTRAHYWDKKIYTHEFEDILSYCFEGLIRAARNFDPDRGTFSTIAYLSMDSEISKMLRNYNATKRKGDKVSSNIESFINKNNDEAGYNVIPELQYHANYDRIIQEEEILKLLTYLNDDEKYVLIRISEGFKQREIAKDLNVSQTQISRILQKARRKARIVMEKVS